MRHQKKVMIMIGAAVLLTLGWPAAHADPLGTSFTYQGFLTITGAPYTGTADIRIFLWNDPADLAPLAGPLDVIDMNVANGLFTIPVDFGVNHFTDEARWIEIGARAPAGAGDFTMFQPLQPLTAAPYALQTRGLFVNGDRLVGIGTASPAARLHVAKSFTTPADYAFTVTTFGLNQIATRSVSINSNNISARNGAGEDADILLNSGSTRHTLMGLGDGRVGIGTTDPIYKCHVEGNLGAQQDGVGMYFTKSGDASEIVHVGTTGSGVRQQFRIGKTNLFPLVGIGNDDPQFLLQVGTPGSANNGNGAHVTNGGVWTNGSDVNSKRDFEQIDGRVVLEKVAALPVTRWRYKGEADSVRHIGPMAQDFKAAFGLGESERHIGTVDADGVALAAIQGLNAIVKAQQTVIEKQAAQLAAMEARLAAIEQSAVPE